MRKTPMFIAIGITMAILMVASEIPLTAKTLPGQSGVPLSRRPDAPALPDPNQLRPEVSKGKFLVASRNLGDPRFRETVILLLSYDEQLGAMGLIINRPTKLLLSEVFPESKNLKKKKDSIYYGGPVEAHRMLLLIRSRTRPEGSAPVIEGVYVSTSNTVLERMINRRKKGKQFRVYAGYAGWSPGQLDGEIARGDWLVAPADENTLFDKKPSKIWKELFRRSSAILVRNDGMR